MSRACLVHVLFVLRGRMALRLGQQLGVPQLPLPQECLAAILQRIYLVNAGCYRTQQLFRKTRNAKAIECPNERNVLKCLRLA